MCLCIHDLFHILLFVAMAGPWNVGMCVCVCVFYIYIYIYIYINFISQHVPLQKQYYMLGIAYI